MNAQDERTSNPKVFISYAHETPEHKNWVKSLASELRAGGINALLDEWCVDLGEDFTMFMDEIRTCERVLLICTPAYARKSNEGEGGVGYERSVITAELAKKIATAKFVCVLRAGDSNEGIPTFAQSHRYTDFRADAEYDVRFEELLRSLHNVPADPEPPLGSNPYARDARRGDAPPRAHADGSDDETATETVIREADAILLRVGRPGWNRLVRRTAQTIRPRLLAWSTEASEATQTEGERASIFDTGVEVAEPLIALALTAIDSGIPEIRNQAALIDDLIHIEAWASNARTPVVHMPRALGFLYHHIAGAMLVESSNHGDAIRLLTRHVRNWEGTETHPIWQHHDLMGWVDSLDRDWCRSWEYVRSFWGSRKWLAIFFRSERSFFDSYRAYATVASAIELATFLGEGGAPEKLGDSGWLHVPATFVSPGDRDGTSIAQIVQRAIPSVEVLSDIANIGGSDVTAFRSAWPSWFGEWCQFIGQTDRRLGHHLAQDGPPELPR